MSSSPTLGKTLSSSHLELAAAAASSTSSQQPHKVDSHQESQSPDWRRDTTPNKALTENVRAEEPRLYRITRLFEEGIDGRRPRTDTTERALAYCSAYRAGSFDDLATLSEPAVTRARELALMKTYLQRIIQVMTSPTDRAATPPPRFSASQLTTQG